MQGRRGQRIDLGRACESNERHLREVVFEDAQIHIVRPKIMSPLQRTVDGMITKMDTRGHLEIKQRGAVTPARLIGVRAGLRDAVSLVNDEAGKQAMAIQSTKSVL